MKCKNMPNKQFDDTVNFVMTKDPITIDSTSENCLEEND